MFFIGVDPGKSGAVAVIDDTQCVIYLEDMPVVGSNFVPAALRDLFLSFLPIPASPVSEIPLGFVPLLTVVEKQQVFPKQGAVSAFSTGEGFGLIIGILTTLNWSFIVVRPTAWQRELAVSGEDTKAASINRAYSLFPTTNLKRGIRIKKDDHNRSDALLMAEFARRTWHGRQTKD